MGCANITVIILLSPPHQHAFAWAAQFVPLWGEPTFNWERLMAGALCSLWWVSFLQIHWAETSRCLCLNFEQNAVGFASCHATTPLRNALKLQCSFAHCREKTKQKKHPSPGHCLVFLISTVGVTGAYPPAEHWKYNLNRSTQETHNMQSAHWSFVTLYYIGSVHWHARVTTQLALCIVSDNKL